MFDLFASFFKALISFFTSILIMLGVISPKTTQTLVMSIPVTEGLRTVQGGCTDGRYTYVTIIGNEEVTIANPDYTAGSALPETKSVIPCRVIKIDLAGKSIVKTSDELYMDHANDVTYNSKTNELLICNNKPNYTLVTVLDPDTLTVKRTVTVPEQIYSICYVGTSDCYYVGVSYGYSVVTLSSSFEETGTINLQNNGFTKQGIDINGDSLYALYSGENSVYRYDLSGNLTGKLTLPESSNEAEFIFFFNDEMYVGYNFPGVGNGGAIYKLTDVQWES